jgi:glycosyltransferase involved in cell wall biosynthesis
MLPNGVDVEMWQPNLSVRTRIRRELGLGSEFLWLSVGRLEPVKDYPTLLRALALTPHDARLVIAGGGPLEGELVRMVAGMGLENRVRFLGFEPDVLRWMQAADGFVLSSVWEGLPMVLLEAAACALPAVATDIPGTREVMADGHSGWLTTPVDATALAGAMNRMIQLPPEERRAMGERARQGIIERYSLEAVLDRWEALYRDLLKQSGARDAGAAF